VSTKIRKQIYLEPGQEALLKHLSGATGVPEAELIRQAIDRHLSSGQPVRRDAQAWEDERAFITALIAQGRAEGQRRWRREELYER
jgi:hypothetical protein